MDTRLPTDAVFDTPAEYYITYNFQPKSWLDRLVKSICSGAPEDGRLIILSGPQGIGRTYFLEAAACAATKEDQKTRAVHIDLDGFEPDRGARSMADFANHLVAKHVKKPPNWLSNVFEHLSLDIRLFAPSIWAASILSTEAPRLHKLGPLPYRIPNYRSRQAFHYFLPAL